MEKAALFTGAGSSFNFDALLKIGANDSLELVKAIEKGLSFNTLERVRKETGLPMESLALSIGISQRTLTRRKKEKRLTSSESDRLVSVSRLLAQAVKLFSGDREKAFGWFRKPNRALGDLSPLQMASTETGAREVENLIGRLEHGVFS